MLGYYPKHDHVLIVFVQKVEWEHFPSSRSCMGLIWTYGMEKRYDIFSEDVIKSVNGVTGRWCVAFVREHTSPYYIEGEMSEIVELYPIQHDTILYTTLKLTQWNNAKEGKDVWISA